MLRTIETNGIQANVAVTGAGPAVVLLHGFPHTWRLWREVIEPLAAEHRVIAPDLRGFGDSTRAADGYDAGTLAADIEGILDALGEPTATLVGIDAGTPVALLLALRRPERVRRLVVMEALLGAVPGPGTPWWFGFHAVPGLAETVLNGHEADYLDFFLDSGTQGHGIPDDLRAEFHRAYTGSEALRCAFEYYRALPTTARQLAEFTRLDVPTMAIGAHPVGGRLEEQLRPIAAELTGHVIPDCGHIIPLDRPRELLALLLPFV